MRLTRLTESCVWHCDRRKVCLDEEPSFHLDSYTGHEATKPQSSKDLPQRLEVIHDPWTNKETSINEKWPSLSTTFEGTLCL